MNIVLWVFFFILVVITDVLVFRYIGRLRMVNIFSPVRFLLLLMVVLLQWPTFWVAMTQPRRMAFYSSGMTQGIIASAIAPLLVLLGAVLVGRPRTTWDQWWGQPLLYLPSQALVLKFFGALILVGVVVQILAVGGIGAVPLVANFFRSGDSAYLRDLREYAMKIQPWYVKYTISYTRGFLTFFALAGLVTLLYHKVSSRAYVLGLLILAVINAAMQGAKDPPVAVLLAAATCWFLASRRKLRLAYVAVGLVFLSLIPLFFELARLRGRFTIDTLTTTYERIGVRLFYVPSLCNLGYFAYVPQISGDYYYGRTVSLLANIAHVEHAPMPLLVTAEFSISASRTAFSNASFYADAWANFGWFGVVFICIFMGAFMATVEKMMLSCRRSLFCIGCVVTLTIGCRVLISGPATSFLLSGEGGLVLLLGIVAVMRDRNTPVVDDGFSTEQLEYATTGYRR